MPNIKKLKHIHEYGPRWKKTECRNENATLALFQVMLIITSIYNLLIGCSVIHYLSPTILCAIAAFIILSTTLTCYEREQRIKEFKIVRFFFILLLFNPIIFCYKYYYVAYKQ